MISKKALADWGRQILAGSPESNGAFIQPAKAPESWFAGVNGVVDRVLITAGGAECLHDDIVEFGQRLKTHHRNVELVVQKGGLHDDPLLDFFTREKKLGSITPLVVDWIASGFT